MRGKNNPLGTILVVVVAFVVGIPALGVIATAAGDILAILLPLLAPLLIFAIVAGVVVIAYCLMRVFGSGGRKVYRPSSQRRHGTLPPPIGLRPRSPRGGSNPSSRTRR